MLHPAFEIENLFNNYLKIMDDAATLETKLRSDTIQYRAEIKTLFDIQDEALRDKYASIAKNSEGAMEWEEIKRSIHIFRKLEKEYAEEFKRKGGTEPILKDLEQYLIEKCGDSACGRFVKKREYRKKDPKEVRLAKTALRALLDDTPNSQMGSWLHPEAGEISGAGQFFKAREMLAYFWLAANDPLLTPAQIEDEKAQVMYGLADIRREHNGDIRSKHHPIDEPSCPTGNISRMGLMHVHNPKTAIAEFTDPSTHFENRMQAFILQQFQALPPSKQRAFVLSINHKLIMQEEDANASLMSQFIRHLLTVDNLSLWMKNLNAEFGDLNSSYLKMALVHFVRESTQLATHIAMPLLNGFEAHVLGALKEEVEDNLGKQPDIKPIITELAMVYKQLSLLKSKIIELHHLPASGLSSTLALGKTREALKAEYDEWHDKKIALMDSVQQHARKYYETSLIDYQTSLQQYKPSPLKLVKPTRIDSLTFEPFWVKKFATRFIEKEAQCKLAFIAFDNQLYQLREEKIFEIFIPYLQSSLFHQNSIQKPLQTLSHDIEEYLTLLAQENSETDDKRLLDQANNIHQHQHLLDNEIKRSIQDFEGYLRSQNISLLESDKELLKKILMGEKNEVLVRFHCPSHFLEIFQSIHDRMSQATFLQTAQTEYQNAIVFLENKFVKLAVHFLKDIQFHIDDLREKSNRSPLTMKQLAALEQVYASANAINATFIEQHKTKHLSIPDYVKWAHQLQMVSDELDASLQKIGYPASLEHRQVVKKLTTMMKHLRTTTKKDDGMTKEEVKKTLLFGRFTPGHRVPDRLIQDTERVKKNVKTQYQRYLDQQQKDRAILSSSSSMPTAPLLTAQQIQSAELYIMLHENNPHILGLEDYLLPGIIVNIQANQDPARVAFRDPFGIKSMKYHEIPIATLKEYNQKYFQIQTDLDLPADILLESFSSLLACKNEKMRDNLIFYYIKQLYDYREHPIFSLALHCQKSEELTLILETLNKNKPGHRFYAIKESLILAINDPSRAYTPDQQQEKLHQARETLERELPSLFVNHAPLRKRV